MRVEEREQKEGGVRSSERKAETEATERSFVSVRKSFKVGLT